MLRELGVVAAPTGIGPHLDELLEPRVVLQKMRMTVKDELAGKLSGVLVAQLDIGGLGLAYLKDRAVNIVHREERYRHP